MDSPDWSRLFPLLDELLELDQGVRDERLAALRDNDPALAAELTRLLTLEQANPEFMKHSAVQAALQHPADGRQIGPYRLQKEIGEGGMGQVWLAERADGLYQRRVALKLLRPGYASADLQQRFAREQQILARLAHAHIARLLDAGISADGQPFLVLEYIDGEPITSYCRRMKLSVEGRLELILQVCDAVSHAHASLVVHRDLKPSNILVTPAGDVRLLDFGIAKLLDIGGSGAELTRADARAFTLHYAAPEQLRGEPVSTMTDVYAVGVVLYELLTGLKPYRPENNSDSAWETAILESDAVRPSQAVLKPQALSATGAEPALSANPRLSRVLAGDLDNILLKALHKLPARRYASIEALAQDLRRYLDGKPVSARPISVTYRFSKYMKRHGLAVAAVTGVMVVLGGSLMMTRWQAQQAVREAARAQAMQAFVVNLFEADSIAGGQSMDLRTLLHAGAQRARSELADAPRSLVTMLVLIARLRNNLGDHREAIAVLEPEEQALDRIADEGADLRLEWLSELGRALRGIGDSGQCVQRLQPELPLIAAVENPAVLAVAEFQSQLGRCQRMLGKRQEAQALYQSALAARVEQGDILAEAESLADLAILDADAGLLDSSIAGLRQSLGRLAASDQPVHPLAIGIWRSLASLYRERGDVPAAEGAARQALEIAQRLHGPGHPSIAQSQQQLGSILIDQGLLDEAEALIQAAHASLVAQFGELHPELGATFNALAIIAFERGDLDLAQARLLRSNEIWRQSPSQFRLSGGQINLGRVLLAAGRPAEAEQLFADALSLRTRQYGQDHAQIGAVLRFLGEAQMAQGDFDTALTNLTQAVELLAGHYGPNHPQCGNAELSLARVRSRRGEIELARNLIVQVTERFPGQDSESRRLRWWAVALLAEADCGMGERQPALGRLRSLLAEVGATLPDSSLQRDIQAISLHCADEVKLAGPGSFNR